MITSDMYSFTGCKILMPASAAKELLLEVSGGPGPTSLRGKGGFQYAGTGNNLATVRSKEEKKIFPNFV